MTVLRVAHALPGQEDVSFKLAQQLIKIAPGCPNIDIEDKGCSRFNDADIALAEAKKLAKSMASQGYTGKVRIVGNQTLTFEVLQSVAGTMKILGFLPNPYVSIVKQACEKQNTPIEFTVCAEDVELGLFPCEATNSSSRLDRDHKPDRTIVCSVDGKRANQECLYKSDKKCPESIGVMECEQFNCCDYYSCQWQKPSICTN